MKRLIVNADDFGLSDGISDGIAALIGQCGLTSTTVMVCAAGAEGRVRRQTGALRGRSGVHLQLTAGRPCLPSGRVASLVGPDGAFPRRVPAGFAPDPAEVAAEWTAQIETLSAWGIHPTHLDGHHHVHMHPACRPALIAVARRFSLPVRAVAGEDVAVLRRNGIACPDVFVRDFDEGARTPERFLSLVRDAAVSCPEDGVIEVMVHPGVADPGLPAITSYATERGEELAALAISGAHQAAEKYGLVPVSYARLARDVVDIGQGAKE